MNRSRSSGFAETIRRMFIPWSRMALTGTIYNIASTVSDLFDANLGHCFWRCAVLNHPFLLPRITNPALEAIATTPTGRETILRLSPLALKSLSRSVSAVRPDTNAMTPAIISTIPTTTVSFMMLNSPSELPSFRLGWRFQIRLRASPSKPA